MFVVSAAPWSNFVPNLSEIEQSAAEICDLNRLTLSSSPTSNFVISGFNHARSLTATADATAAAATATTTITITTTITTITTS